MSIIIALTVLFTLLIVGLPVALSIALSGAAGLFVIGGIDLVIGVGSSTAASAVDSYELIMVPMFILMANFILASGVSDDLFEIARTWMGRVPGGLAHATALTGAAFGAISGSTTAAAATLSTTSIPGMIKQGYDSKLAAGVVAISGTLAMLIPPSGAMIIYALVADLSVARLLIAGLIPGLLVTATIMLTIMFLVWRHPEHAPSAQKYTWREKIVSLRYAWSFLLLFVTVTVVIYTGIGTPTEASALGALAACLLAIARKTPPARLINAVIVTAEASCMIAFIIIGAQIFGYFLTLSQATQGLITYFQNSGIPPTVIMLMILLLYLLLGCFMDLISMLILTVPVVSPLMSTLGYDPIWLAVITIVMGEIGVLTPPLGMNVFVISKYTRMPVTDVFRGAFPHVIAHLIVVAILIMFPWIVTWLPSTMN